MGLQGLLRIPEDLPLAVSKSLLLRKSQQPHSSCSKRWLFNSSWTVLTKTLTSSMLCPWYEQLNCHGPAQRGQLPSLAIILEAATQGCSYP